MTKRKTSKTKKLSLLRNWKNMLRMPKQRERSTILMKNNRRIYRNNSIKKKNRMRNWTDNNYLIATMGNKRMSIMVRMYLLMMMLMLVLLPLRNKTWSTSYKIKFPTLWNKSINKRNYCTNLNSSSKIHTNRSTTSKCNSISYNENQRNKLKT